jgi:hypothetical protein
MADVPAVPAPDQVDPAALRRSAELAMAYLLQIQVRDYQTRYRDALLAAVYAIQGRFGPTASEYLVLDELLRAVGAAPRDPGEWLRAIVAAQAPDLVPRGKVIGALRARASKFAEGAPERVAFEAFVEDLERPAPQAREAA